MASRLNKPPAGIVWLHVNRLDDEDGRIWAVQSDRGYDSVRSVICSVPVYSQFFGPKAKQPKAVLVAERATVTIRGAIAYIDAA